MQKEYREITKEQLDRVKDAWSIENMEAHGAKGREVSYIGSRTGGYLDGSKAKRVTEYYRDETGAYWHQDGAMLPDGTVISMEKFLFGRELRRNPAERQRRKKH